MPPPPFSFRYDRAQRTVIATLRGHWTMATVAAYTATVLADMRATPTGTGPRNALFDIRDCGLLVREVAEALTDFRRRHVPGMARVAIVSRSALDAMRARRITSCRNMACSPRLEAAREWLARPPA